MSLSGDGPVFGALLDGRWDGQGSTNGGFLLALATRAVGAVLPFPDPLVVSGFYLRPGTPGPAEIRTEVIQAGRTTGFGEAGVYRDGKQVLRATAAYTDLDGGRRPRRPLLRRRAAAGPAAARAVPGPAPGDRPADHAGRPDRVPGRRAAVVGDAHAAGREHGAVGQPGVRGLDAVRRRPRARPALAAAVRGRGGPRRPGTRPAADDHGGAHRAPAGPPGPRLARLPHRRPATWRAATSRKTPRSGTPRAAWWRSPASSPWSCARVLAGTHDERGLPSPVIPGAAAPGPGPGERAPRAGPGRGQRTATPRRSPGRGHPAGPPGRAGSRRGSRAAP